jgi:hypothetical protein
MIDSSLESRKYEPIWVTIFQVSNCIQIGNTLVLNAALCWKET